MAENGGPSIILISALGFVIVATIFAFTFGPSLIRQSRQSDLLESGIEAPARIVELEETGKLVNYAPEVRIVLEVDPAQGDAFRSETLMVLSAPEAPKYQPGKQVRVRFDPENPSVAAIVDPASG